MSAQGFVLTFHSQNVAGNDYGSNDHVALDETLSALAAMRIPVLRLWAVVRALRGRTFDALPERFVALTFDDGTDYDWRDLDVPGHGPQRSMFSILESHSRRGFFGRWKTRVPATSFVIASPEGRRELSAAQLSAPDLIQDDWWRPAHASGLLDIGNHGWDHVHPAVSSMQSRPHLIEAFARVDSEDEARLQVAEAGRYIRSKAGRGAARLFAYPYGQVSEFLACDYFPRQRECIGAFATVPEAIHAQSDAWRLPRYVCGWHWQRSDDLAKLLR